MKNDMLGINLSSSESSSAFDNSMRNLEFMNEAYKKAAENALNNFKTGGPFGTVIVLNGKIVGSGRNQVLENNDPSAHDVMQAIRKACENLATYDLTGCILYTTCYPCTMCLTAARCANINKIYYGNTKEDAAAIGFSDDEFYTALRNKLNGEEGINDVIELSQIGRDLTLLNKFKEMNGNKY